MRIVKKEVRGRGERSDGARKRTSRGRSRCGDGGGTRQLVAHLVGGNFVPVYLGLGHWQRTTQRFD